MFKIFIIIYIICLILDLLMIRESIKIDGYIDKDYMIFLIISFIPAINIIISIMFICCFFEYFCENEKGHEFIKKILLIKDKQEKK